MAFEILHLLKFVELDVDTDGVMTFELKTDYPGAMAVRYAGDFNTESTTTGRSTVRLTLAGTTRGRMLRAKVYGLVVGKLYGARVFARALPDGDWDWYPLPVRVTAEAYAAAALPLRATSDAFSVSGLPIRETPDGFAKAGLPIRGTPDEWSRGPLPIPETALIPRWASLAMDAIE